MWRKMLVGLWSVGMLSAASGKGLKILKRDVLHHRVLVGRYIPNVPPSPKKTGQGYWRYWNTNASSYYYWSSGVEYGVNFVLADINADSVLVESVQVYLYDTTSAGGNSFDLHIYDSDGSSSLWNYSGTSVSGGAWYRIPLSSPVKIKSSDFYVAFYRQSEKSPFIVSDDGNSTGRNYYRSSEGSGDWTSIDYGWLIETFVTYWAPDTDIAVSEIIEPHNLVLYVDSVYTPEVRVSNLGGYDVENIHVYFEIYDGANLVYADTENITSLPAGNYVDVTFSKTYTATEPVPRWLHMVAYVEHLENDVHPDNDTVDVYRRVWHSGNDFLALQVGGGVVSMFYAGDWLQSKGYAGKFYYGNYALGQWDSLNFINYDAVWIGAGVYDKNYVIDSAHGAHIEAYLRKHGKVFLEGGDIWYYDPQYGGAWNPNPWFAVSPLDDGAGDLGPVHGWNNSLIPEITVDSSWDYAGDNSYIDHLGVASSLEHGGTADTVLVDSNDVMPSYVCGIAYHANSPDYFTFAFSGEIGGLVSRSKSSPVNIVYQIQQTHFGVSPTYVEENIGRQFTGYSVKAMPNPIKSEGKLVFVLPRASKVQIAIYDASGRLVKKVADKAYSAGLHVVNLNLQHLKSGIYFYRFRAGNYTKTQKLVIIK